MTTLVTVDVIDGTSIDATDVNNNMAAVRAVINGGLDNSNLASAAAIAISKLANFPSDATRFLRGDGNWAVPAGGGGGGGPVSPSDIVGYPSDPSKFLRGDGNWAAVTVAPASIGGFPSDGTKSLRGDGTWGTAYSAAAFIAGYPSDATKFLRGDGVWAAPAGGAGSVAYGTTLPASPVDGQEAILVDSTTNPSYQWRFRYNASSTSPYKWEYIGGAPFQAASSAVNASVVTLAKAGDYDYLATGYQAGTGSTTPSGETLNLVIAGVVVETKTSHTNGTEIGGTTGYHGSVISRRQKAQAANSVIGITGSGRPWDLQITPVRVA